jgi:formate hydrogenlyase subunit 4
MSAGPALEVLQVATLLALAPAFTGWVRTLKCWSQSRRAPGILQPYRDLRKLFVKEVVLAENASWIFRFTPYVVFGTAVLAGGIVPMLTVDLPLAPAADVIVIVALFTVARFFTALAGMDIGTAFGGMGASREMLVASLAEPAMLMAIFTISLGSQSTSLAQIVTGIVGGQSILRPSFAFALLAFVMIALAETGRIPVDNPATHLELTMIHEAMILEYSGRHLALLEWAGMMKLMLFALIGVAAFLPFGIAPPGGAAALLPAFLAMAAKLAAIGAGVVLIETGLAKMRIFRLTEYLGAAFLVATLGMISFFILE